MAANIARLFLGRYLAWNDVRIRRGLALLLLLAELHLLEFLQQLFRRFGPIVLFLVLGYRRLRWICRRLIGRILRIRITIVRTGIVGSILVLICLLRLRLGLPEWLIAGEGAARGSFALGRKNHALHNIGTVGPTQDNIVKA